MTTAGLILAAGEGKRFGGPKAPYVHNGERLVDRAVSVLADAGCNPVFVVLGAWIGEVPGATVLENENWSTGMGSSLQVGLSHLNSEPGIDEVVVSLVDLPGLTSAAVSRIVETPGDIVVGTYDAKRGHPVKFSSATWPELIASATGDQGARAYIADHPDQIVLVEVGDVATGEDMDVRPEADD
jgi:CTP:molybdopterin cytidylyltransferase MocA